MNVRGRRSRTWSAVALALVIAACGGSDDGPVSVSRSTTTTAGARSTATSAEGGSTPPASEPPGGQAADSDAAERTTSTAARTATSSSTALPSTTTLVIRAGAGGATDLQARAECIGTPPRPVVHLRWTPGGRGRQRVDVSVIDNSFEPGTYESSELLGAATSDLDWHRARSEATHLWRVLTEADDAWIASATGRFDGPGCVGVDPQQP